MTQQGIYILANDFVIEASIALVKSVRRWSPNADITLIPYNEQLSEIKKKLVSPFNLKIFENPTFDNWFYPILLHPELQKSRPSMLRKLACWFGNYDRFLYIDTDIVVFEDVTTHLNLLSEYEFLTADYQRNNVFRDVFPQSMIEKFPMFDTRKVFNAGFFASRKDALSKEVIVKELEFFSNNPSLFFQHYGDQSFLNYLVLKRGLTTVNLIDISGNVAGNWAGSPHFLQKEDYLLDGNQQKLRFLHWAGFRISEEAPYWDIWRHYRYLGEELPLPVKPPRPMSRLFNRLKTRLKGYFYK